MILFKENENYMNNKLIDYIGKKNNALYNEWIIFDFPTLDLVRNIYE